MRKAASLFLSILLIFSLASIAFCADESKPFENSAFFTDGDYTVHYRVYDCENPKGQIMLLHGFGLSSASMDPIATVYRAWGYRTVTVDLPNFGYSSRESRTTELLDREVIVYDLMSSLGGKWIVGGHSMGGGIAANVAIDHPSDVEALLLFAPQTSAQSGASSKIFANPVMTTFFDAIISVGVRIPGAIRLLVAYSFSSTSYAMNYDCGKIADPLKIKSTGAGIAVMSSHTRGTDIDAFSALTMPICIITASNDMVANKDNLNALVNSGAGNLVCHEVDKGGHMMFEFDPLNTAELTLPTIESIA